MEQIKKRKRVGFWHIYLIVVLVIIALIAGGLVYLWQVMHAYEQSTPQHALQAAEHMFSAEHYETLAQNGGIAESPYESTDARRTAFQDVLSGGELHSARLAGSGDSNMQSYQVSAGDTVIGGFDLVFTDTGMFGEWQVENAKLNASPFGELTVRTPSTAQLSINNVPAGAETISQEHVPYETLARLPEDIAVPTQTEYHITGLSMQPQILVASETGAELAVTMHDENPWLDDENEGETTQAAEEMQYATVTLPEPQEDLAALQEMALEDAENYSRYLSNDNTFTTLAARLLPNSDIYTEMRAMETMFYTPHTSVSFTDAQASNIEQYGPDIFSIDADYLYTVYRGDDRPYPFDTKVTFVYVRDDDDWRIGDIQIRA